MSELRFDHVTVSFGTGHNRLAAVDDASLVVPSGQIVGLVGESGSGKTTLGRTAVGLSPHQGGRILLDGRPLRSGESARGRRPVQMVFQDPYSSLDPRMCIGESIAEAIPGRRLGRGAERRRRVHELLELVELDGNHASMYPSQLSGGQRQRVAFARALAARPEVIIADEITSALDVSIQGSVLNLVRDLRHKLDLSILLISHNVAIVRYVSDVIAVMYLGKVVEYGATADVLSDGAQHPYTRDLLDAVPDPNRNILSALDTDPALRAVEDAEPADPRRLPPGCGYHPRCPVGPLVLEDRELCVTSQPTTADHRNLAACHFADGVRPVALLPSDGSREVGTTC